MKSTQPKLWEYTKGGDVPIAIALTEFHLIMLFRDHYAALCLLNEKIVMTEGLSGGSRGIPMSGLAYVELLHLNPSCDVVCVCVCVCVCKCVLTGGSEFIDDYLLSITRFIANMFYHLLSLIRSMSLSLSRVNITLQVRPRHGADLRVLPPCDLPYRSQERDT